MRASAPLAAPRSPGYADAIPAPTPHPEARRELARNLAMLYARDGRLIEAAALLREAQGNSEPPPASK